MNYQEHYDTWQSESAYMSRNTCSYCGALNCDGTCTLPEIEEELNHLNEILENVEAHRDNLGCPMSEAMERVWPEGVKMGYNYGSLCDAVEQMENTFQKLQRKKGQHEN